MSQSPTEKASTSQGLRRSPRQVRSQERFDRILAVAQQLFVEEGYAATTTNAIASQADVPIGSLYQFFPDKAAILQELSRRHAEQLRHRLKTVLDAEAVDTVSLSEFVMQLIDTTQQFFIESPGYHAIYMQVQGTMPELDEIDQVLDNKLIQDLSVALSRRNTTLSLADCNAISFILVKATGNLLWMALSQEEAFQQRLIAETKCMTLSYLQNYFR